MQKHEGCWLRHCLRLQMIAADLSESTPLNPQVMFKANIQIYKKHGLSKFDHTIVRKKTQHNELDG